MLLVYSYATVRTRAPITRQVPIDAIKFRWVAFSRVVVSAFPYLRIDRDVKSYGGGQRDIDVAE